MATIVAERCDMAKDATHSFGESYDTPFTTPKELRKILGKDASEMSDEELQKVGITLGKIALLLIHNQQIGDIDDN